MYLYTDCELTNTTDVSGLLCVTFFDKNCESFAAKNPKASMAVSNFGGGVLNGTTLGNADWLLPKGAEGNYSRNSNFHTAGEVAGQLLIGGGAAGGVGKGICFVGGKFKPQLFESASVGKASHLFGRGRSGNAGKLNSNDFLRLGWGWDDIKKIDVFRISIGGPNVKLPFWKHKDLF